MPLIKFLINVLTFHNDLFSVNDITGSLDIVDLDFQKVSDIVPHNELMFEILVVQSQ